MFWKDGVWSIVVWKQPKRVLPWLLPPHVRLLDVNHVIEGRTSMVRVKVRGVKLYVFNCYCPTEQYAESTKQAFYQTLHKEIRRAKRDNPSFKVIVACDFNATIGMDCDPSKWLTVCFMIPILPVSMAHD
jgi:exonuclease III